MNWLAVIATVACFGLAAGAWHQTRTDPRDPIIDLGTVDVRDVRRIVDVDTGTSWWVVLSELGPDDRDQLHLLWTQAQQARDAANTTSRALLDFAQTIGKRTK